jgi:hypothetical protein
VLAGAAGLEAGFAALDAGRGQVYVREQRSGERGMEYLLGVEELVARAGGQRVVVAEEKLLEPLSGVQPVLRALRPADMLGPVRRCFAAGGTDVAWADANYVVPEDQIYRRLAAGRVKDEDGPRT